MANDGRIDDIVSEEALAQVEKLTASLNDAQAVFVSAAMSAKAFTAEISGAKSLKEFNAAVADTTKKISEMQKQEASAASTSAKLEATKQKAAEDSAKRLRIVQANTAAEVKAMEDLAATTAKAGEVVNEYDKAQADAANTATTWTAANNEAADAVKKNTAAQKEEVAELSDLDKALVSVSGTLEQNIKQQIELKLRSSQISDAQKELKAAFDAGTISEKKYIDATAQLEKEQTEVKQAIQENATAIRQQAKETNAANTSYNAQSAQLDKLRTVYKNLTEEEKKNSQVGGVILKNIQDLDKSLKDQDKSMGVSTRNVGNYESAFKGLPGAIGSTASSVMDFGKALFASPIGIVAGLLLLLYKSFQQNDDAANKLAGVTKGISAIFSGLGSIIADYLLPPIEQFIESVGYLLALIPGLDTVIDGFKATIREAVNYEVALDALEESGKKFNVRISENNLLIQKQATIVRDSTKSLKERLAALDEQSRLEQETTLGRLALIDSEIYVTKRYAATLEATSKDREEYEFKILDLQAKRNEALLDQETLETSIAKRRSAFIKELAAEEKKRQDDAAKDAYELAKTRLEVERDSSEKLLQDNTNAYELRLASEEVYFNRSKDLLDLKLKNDLRGVEDGSDKQKTLYARYYADLDNLQIKHGTTQLKIMEEDMSSEEKLIAQNLKDRLALIEAARDNEAAKVQGSDKAAIEARKAIDEKYLREYVKAQIDAIETVARAKGLDAEGEKELAALKRKYNEIGLKGQLEDEKDHDKALQELEKQRQKFKQDLGAAATTFLKNVSNKYFQNELDGVSSAKEAEQERYDAQRDAIEKSGASEEKKAVLLDQLDRQKAARDKDLAEQEKRIKLQQAKFQRTIDIATIVAKTAIAVVNQLGTGDPYTAFARAALAAGAGALQVALVLSQPLPQFRHGGTMGHDGPARFSEEGPELRIDPSGKMSLTPERETVGFVKAGTRFVSNKDLRRMIASSTVNTDTVIQNDVDFTDLIKAGEKNTRELKQALEKKYQRPLYMTQRQQNDSDYMRRNFGKR